MDRNDPRPVWVPVWGGPNCLAQALWKVRATRSPDALRPVRRQAARLYDLGSGRQRPWIRKTFPDLFYIASPGMHAGGAYHHATWTGISGDKFHGRFAGADFSIVDNPWLDQNIRSKGPLGAQYPRDDVPDGRRHAELSLSHQQRPRQSGASRLGQLGRPLRALHAAPAEMVLRTGDAAVLERHGRRGPRRRRQLAHEQQGHDLALACGLSERFRRAHGLDDQAVRGGQPSARRRSSRTPASSASGPASASNLSAEGSSDPDGHALSYEWFYYGEPGTLLLSSGRTGAPLRIEESTNRHGLVHCAKGPKPETMHIILAVTDQGTPPLTRYQRVIVTIVP